MVRKSGNNCEYVAAGENKKVVSTMGDFGSAVLAVGPGRWSDDEGKHFALDIKVGDVVLYSKYGGTEVTHGGDDLLILTSRDVLAVVA